MSDPLDDITARIVGDPDDDALRLEAAALFDATDGALMATTPPVGTFCPLSYDGLSDARLGAVPAILHAQGYVESGPGRLRYQLAKDGAPSRGAWVYWLEVTEYSDAPIVEVIKRVLK